MITIVYVRKRFNSLPNFWIIEDIDATEFASCLVFRVNIYIFSDLVENKLEDKRCIYQWRQANEQLVERNRIVVLLASLSCTA